MPLSRLGRNEAGESTGAPDAFRPIRVLEIEIGQPLQGLTASSDERGHPYEAGLALVRLHGQPIGTVALALTPEGLTPQALGDQLRAGLEASGSLDLLADASTFLPGMGRGAMDAGTVPRAVAARDAFLARAPFASVVIATRNRPDNLARCLASLEQLVYPRFEVIVVDNAPDDDATERYFAAHHAEHSAMRYVREDRPGLASAHNRGIREMRPESRFVAFTDDDVVVDPYWLCELMRGFEAAPNVGCVTGMIFPAELETWPQVLIEEFGGFNKGFRRQMYDLHAHRPADPLFPFTPGKFGSGANMAFRTEALARIGGFDPAMGTGTLALGADDLAAFFRIITEGYTLVYEPTAIVRHTHYRDFAALRRQIYGYGVGLTAFATKALADQPGLLLSLLRRTPRGLHYALSPASGKNLKKGRDYPPELTTLERKGMIYGPLAFLRSRWAARAYDGQAGR